MNYGLPSGLGIRVNRAIRVDAPNVRVDSAYIFKVLLVDSSGGFTVNTPTHVDSLLASATALSSPVSTPSGVSGSMFSDAPSYNQPTLPGWFQPGVEDAV